MLKDLVLKNRSCRRFYQSERISEDTLRELTDLARMTASSANCQALKYYLAADEEICARIYPSLAWAGALPDWDGPEEGERPAAYIVIACDESIAKSKMWDEGIAAQTIMLGAAEKGLGGCMLGSINRSQLARTLKLDSERYHISLVLALGKPKETIVTVPVGEDGSTTYYRDENQVHYVPKRSLEEIIL